MRRQDELLPQDAAAELVVIQCIMAPGAADTMLAGMASRGITERHFHIPAHQTIVAAIKTLRQLEPPVEPNFVSLGKLLRDLEQFDAVGGASFLSKIVTDWQSGQMAWHYLDIVTETWQRRSLILSCDAAVESAYAGAKVSEETVPLIEGLQAELANISAMGSAASSFTTIQELMKEAGKELYARYKMRGRFSGITTGIADIDRMTDGLMPEQLVLIPARPSMGKSALLFQIGLHAARRNSYHHDPEVWKRERVPVGAFSAEMSDLLLGQRFVSHLTGISVKSFATGFLSEKGMQDAMQKMTAELENMEGVKFLVDDTPGLSIQQLEARARYLVIQHGVKLLLVDYAQLLTSSSKKAERSRLDEVSEVSLGLKRIARQLKVPMVVAVQLNRDVDDRPGHVPLLSDMRECGQLEQDADVVICPVRPEYYAKDDAQRGKALTKYKLAELPLDDGAGRDLLGMNYDLISEMNADEKRFFLLDRYAELHVVKQRGGSTGVAKCWYQKEQCWFHGWTKKPFSNNPNERQQNLAENHGEKPAPVTPAAPAVKPVVVASPPPKPQEPAQGDFLPPPEEDYDH